MVISGLGAGLNELIALAGTSEMVPVAKRGAYVGGVVFTILPFCASGLWAQLISESNWRWNGLLISVWNLVGLVLLMFCYKEPPKHHVKSTKQILTEIDKIGAFLSISGVLLFMMVLLDECARSGAFCPRNCLDHCLLRLGVQVCQVPNGSSQSLLERQADHDPDPAYDVLERRKLLRCSAVLAYPGTQHVLLVYGLYQWDLVSSSEQSSPSSSSVSPRDARRP
nr:hypothetical protein CFP56_20999 [Quercus suber]